MLCNLNEGYWSELNMQYEDIFSVRREGYIEVNTWSCFEYSKQWKIGLITLIKDKKYLIRKDKISWRKHTLENLISLQCLSIAIK